MVKIIRKRIQDCVFCEDTNLSNSARDKARVKHHSGFHHVALELCARKVASSGDIRQLLDLCLTTLEFAEIDYKANGHIKSDEHLPFLVRIEHVSKAMARLYGPTSSHTSIKDLQLQHQLVLMAIFLLQKDDLDISESSVRKYTQIWFANADRSAKTDSSIHLL